MSKEEDGEKQQSAQEYQYQQSGFVIKKMHGPETFHDKQIHTNIPKNLLTSTLLLVASENALRKLTEGDVTILHQDGKKVTILREDEAGELIPYRTITRKAWKENLYFSDFWAGFSGTLMEQLMSVPVKSDEGGWRSEQAVKEVSALTNSERIMSEASNQNKPGILKRLIQKVT